MKGILKGLQSYRDGIFDNFLNTSYAESVNGLSKYCKDNNKNKLVYIRHLIDYCYENGYALVELGSLYRLNRRFIQGNLIHIVKYDIELLRECQGTGIVNLYKNLSINKDYHNLIEDCIQGKGSVLEMCNKRNYNTSNVRSYIRNLAIIDNDLYKRYENIKYKGINSSNIKKYNNYEESLIEYLQIKDITLIDFCRDNFIDYVEFSTYINYILVNSNNFLYEQYKQHRKNNKKL